MVHLCVHIKKFGMLRVNFFLIPADSAAAIIDVRGGQYNLKIVSRYFSEMFNNDMFDDIETKF